MREFYPLNLHLTADELGVLHAALESFAVQRKTPPGYVNTIRDLLTMIEPTWRCARNDAVAEACIKQQTE